MHTGTLRRTQYQSFGSPSSTATGNHVIKVFQAMVESANFVLGLTIFRRGLTLWLRPRNRRAKPAGDCGLQPRVGRHYLLRRDTARRPLPDGFVFERKLAGKMT